jgi:DUF1009 family protein
MESIGVIAGNGQFPLLFTQAARAAGFKVVAVAFSGETSPALGQLADEITWINPGHLGKLIKTFKRAGVRRAVMCGGIKKTRMFKDIVPDFKALSLLPRLRSLADDGILRALAQILDEEGVSILPSHEMAPDLLAEAGNYTRRRPTPREQADIELGWHIFERLGPLDIGQALVIKDKTVVAVEAIEGTDACIRRGAELAGEGTLVLKRCKPNQDRRFDLPAIGRQTIAVMVEAKASCLCVEAGGALVFDRAEMVALADQHEICVVAQ